MFDRFTDRARKVMARARKEAQRFNHDFIGTEHILLGLIREGPGVAANVLKNLKVDLDKIRREIEKNLQSGPSIVTMGQLPFTPRAKKVLVLSMEEATNLGHNYIGTEHLLLGLLREQDGVAAEVLSSFGLEIEAVRKEVLALLGQEPGKAAAPSATRQNLAELLGASGWVAFDVASPDGKIWARLGLNAENQPQLCMFDATGAQRIVLGLDASGEPRLEFRDRDGKVTFHLP